MHLLRWGGGGVKLLFNLLFLLFPISKNSRTAMDLKLVAYTSVCIHVCHDRSRATNILRKYFKRCRISTTEKNVAPKLLGEVTEVMG